MEPAAFSAAVSHFLNCLLSSSSCIPDSCSDELLSRRRSRRRRNQGSRVALLTHSLWAKMTPSELWDRIRAEAGDYYQCTFDRYACACACVCVWLDLCNSILHFHPLCVQWKCRWSHRKARPSEDLPAERTCHQDRHPGKTSARLLFIAHLPIELNGFFIS